MKDDVKLDGYTLDQGLAAVGTGWAPLVQRAFADLPDGARIVQVKEKLGLLRIYAHDANGEHLLLNHLDQLEKESGRICEDCGAPGTTERLRPESSWVRTLCAVCRESHQ